MRIVVLPEWGGKIASLYDRRRKREWLHTNPNFRFRLPVYGSDYVGDYDIGGFDECFPNIGSGPYPVWPWQGIMLPDHGEVWALPWDVARDSAGLTLTVEGVRLPYRLEKRLELRSDGLWMGYRALNRSPFDMPVLWSSHPLVNVRAGMRLQVPAESVRVDSCNARFAELTGLEPGQIVSWPMIAGQDMRTIPGPEAETAAKLTARQLREGIVALVDPADEARLAFHFEPASVTHCGLWLNYGGWAGKPGAAPYYNIGLEPCIGVADRLDLALQAGEAGLLPARGELSWHLQLRLG
jgi:galactose mutarotase-like enzyme